MMQPGALLQVLEMEAWPAAYISFELGLLAVLGFGLALDRCARTGASEGLAYISPRAGAAVTAEAAGELADWSLVLPGFVTGGDDLSDKAVLHGLKPTAHFLRQDAFGVTNHNLPAAHCRLADLFGTPL